MPVSKEDDLMLNISDRNIIDKQLSIAITGMEESLSYIPNCSRNYAPMMEGYNINKGVYLGLMDFLDKNYPAIANDVRKKYEERYERLGEAAERLYHAVFLKCN